MTPENPTPSDALEKEMKRMIRKLASEQNALKKILKNSKPEITVEKSVETNESLKP
jgi:hypothetical protein